MKKIKLQNKTVPNSKTIPSGATQSVPDTEKLAVSAADFMQNRRGRSERYMFASRRVTYRKGGGMPRAPRPRKI